MSRASALLALGFSSVAITFAAPIPPPSEKELIAKHWGATKGAGKFSLDGGRLTIRSDGLRANDSLPHNPNIPHAAKTLTGDFDITVRLAHVSFPNKDVESETDWPETKAGLFLHGGEGIELVLSQSRTPEGEKREVRLLTWHGPCLTTHPLGAVEPGKSTYLRMTRKDKSLTVSHGSDGATWSEPFVANRKSEIEDRVTAGVFLAHNTLQEGASASFDKFTVAKPK